MAEQDNAHSLGIAMQAEREMAAFVKAMTDVVGQSGLRRAGEVWLHAVETLDWPDENHDRFFRRISILAISRLVTNSESQTTVK
jgi:hypothetical protein